MKLQTLWSDPVPNHLMEAAHAWEESLNYMKNPPSVLLDQYWKYL